MLTEQQKLWKQQWRNYVIRHATKEGLVQECLSAYDSYCVQDKYDPNVKFDYKFYSLAAHHALYEWDI
jgi:hypothetical protein